MFKKFSQGKKSLVHFFQPFPLFFFMLPLRKFQIYLSFFSFFFCFGGTWVIDWGPAVCKAGALPLELLCQPESYKSTNVNSSPEWIAKKKSTCGSVSSQQGWELEKESAVNENDTTWTLTSHIFPDFFPQPPPGLRLNFLAPSSTLHFKNVVHHLSTSLHSWPQPKGFPPEIMCLLHHNHSTQQAGNLTSSFTLSSHSPQL
jgi:hypothetical protein